MAQQKKPNKIIQILVGVLTATITTFIIQYFLENESYNVDNLLNEVSQSINKNCPIQLDDETVLITTVCLSNKTFLCNYQLTNIEKDRIEIDAMKKLARPTLIDNIKSNPSFRLLREYKTTFAYSYKDKNGCFLFKISISPELYQ